MKKIYVTMFKYGDCDTICSKHKTYKAAKVAALKCECLGGNKHRIWEIKIHKIKR